MKFKSLKFINIAAVCSVFILACIFAFAWSTSAVAGPYDNTKTSPGTVIVNQAQLSWGANDITQDPIEFRNEFTVVPVSSSGVLKAYRFDPSSSDMFYVRRPLSASDPQSEANFTPAPLPSDAGVTIPGIVPLVEADRILKGTDIYFILEDQGLNFNSSAVDSLVLTLVDSATGDFEVLEIFETGPDTGIFAGYICTCAGSSTSGDGQLYTLPHSQVDVSYQDPWRGERRLEDNVLVGPVDPYGLIFDSRTGAPMNGVEVTIIENATGQPAVVFGDDLRSSYPSTVITGSVVSDSSGREYTLEPGEYRFPFVDLGRYRFEVNAPRGYDAPSLVDDAFIQSLPAAPFSLNAGSRLEPFDVVAGPPIRVDIPLDGSALIDVTRAGSDDTLTVGDAIKFTVTAGSSARGEIIADILDILPSGLSIDISSVQINDLPAAERADVSDDGRSIIFNDVTLRNGQRAEITYVARVTLGANDNKALKSQSTAEAMGFISNTAMHSLTVEPVFAVDKSILLGQVFSNGCEASYVPEEDLSGIRIYLENGRYVETDEAGLFSFRNLPSGAHVLHIDELSLPAGYEAVLCENSTRRAGNAGTTFVETNGGFAGEVFLHIALTDPSAQNIPQIVTELTTQMRVHDLDREWLERSNPATGVVFPVTGYLPRTRSLELAVVRKAGQSVFVKLNNQQIAPIYRRPAIGHSNGETYLDIWNGAPLQSGLNTVSVRIADVTGAIVYEQTKQISFIDQLERLSVAAELSDLSTNGRSNPFVVLRATDRNGSPVHPGTVVNISLKPPFAFASRDDVNKKRQRIAATVDPDGLIRTYLAPVRSSGTAVFRVGTDGDDVEAKAYISAAERPWILVGLADGTAAQQAIADHMKTPGQMGIGAVGPIAIQGRVSLFAEGVIDGKWLTTLRIDTANGSQEQDFFAVDPDKQYIVYGDGSTEGDSSESRNALYLRLQSDTTDILYGDYSTDIRDGLAQYTRQLTGARVVYAGEVVEASAFAASTSQSFMKDVFAANGTSGPFDMSAQNILPFSETVFVETSDRNDAERIVETHSLTRGKDYDIDYRTGRIFLAAPLLSRDAELNTNALIVEYEIEASNQEGLIVGGRIVFKPSDEIRIGMTVVREDSVNGTNGAGSLVGADLEFEITDKLALRTSVALSNQSASDTMAQATQGYASEASLVWDGDNSNAEIYLRSQDTNFGIENQDEAGDQILSSGVVADLLIYQQTWQEFDGTEHVKSYHLSADAKVERNVATYAQSSKAEAVITRDIDGFSQALGLRGIHNAQSNLESEGSSSAIKAIGGVGWISTDKRITLDYRQEMTLHEQGGVSDADRGLLEASYAVSDRLVVSASNEFAVDDNINSNIFAAGAEYNAWEGATLSFGGLLANSDGDSALIGHAGYTQGISLNDAWSVSFGADSQSSLAGRGGDTGPVSVAGLSNPHLTEGYTALRFGFARTVDEWSAGARLERRLGEQETSTRIVFTGVGDFSEHMTFGAKASALYTKQDASAEVEVDHELQASLAYRPRDARFAILDQIEARRITDGPDTRTKVMNSIYVTRHLDGGHELNMRHGIKYASFDFGSEHYSDVLNLLGAEYRHNVSDWFDIGLQGSVMQSLSTSTTQTSAGISLGMTPFENGWISLGYNIKGFADDDFSALGYTDAGVFLQFRLKFDRKTLHDVFSH